MLNLKHAVKLFLLFSFTMLAYGCSSGSASPQETTASSADSDYEDVSSTEISQTDFGGKMVIRNAYMEIEAEDSAKLYIKIINQVRLVNGFESQYDIENYENYSIINAEVRVPADKFDEITEYINDNANVINSSMKSEDITEEYYDVKTRIETKRTSLKTYFNLLEKASSVDEIIQLQSTIDDITLEIESMEGRLKVWSSQISMSTISMLIRQVNDPVKIKKDINWNTLSMADMGYMIKSGFLTTLGYVIIIVQWLLIAVLTILPILIIGCLGYFGFKKAGAKLLSKITKKKQTETDDE